VTTEIEATAARAVAAGVARATGELDDWMDDVSPR